MILRETIVDYISSPWAWPFQFQLEFFYLQCSDGYQLLLSVCVSAAGCRHSAQHHLSTSKCLSCYSWSWLNTAEWITSYILEYMCTYFILKTAINVFGRENKMAWTGEHFSYHQGEDVKETWQVVSYDLPFPATLKDKAGYIYIFLIVSHEKTKANKSIPQHLRTSPTCLWLPLVLTEKLVTNL